MLRILAILYTLIGLSMSAWAQTSADPFRVEMSAVRVSAGESGTIEVRIVVPPEHHIYRDMLRVSVVDSDGLTLGHPDVPPGLKRPDPASPSQSRELYPFDVIVQIPFQAPAGDSIHDPLVEVAYQGCRVGLCFPPAVHRVSPMVTVGSPTGRALLPDRPALVDSVGGGTKSSSFPPQHGVDFSDVPESAFLRPESMGEELFPRVARLVADKDTAIPGDTIRIGVHFEHDNGWHTYWKSKVPGQFLGGSPELYWTLPDGVELGELSYAMPTRFAYVPELGDPLVTYGYDKENLVYAELTFPEDLAGSTVDLKVRVDPVLVCSDETCKPGTGDLSLSLPVGEGNGELNGMAALFDAYEAIVPLNLDEIEGLKSQIQVTVAGPSALVPDERIMLNVLVESLGPELEIPITGRTGMPAEGETWVLETWPGFSPFGPSNIWFEKTTISRLEGAANPTYMLSAFGLVMMPYDKEGLPVLGALLQLKLDGEEVVGEVVADMQQVVVTGSQSEATGSVQSVADFSGLDFAEEIPWIPFNEQNLRAALCTGQPIFVDFTAEWCFSCKVNEAEVLETEKVRGVMADQRVIPLKADYTNYDPLITRWLQKFERGGIPFYLVIPPGGNLTSDELAQIGPMNAEEVLYDNTVVLGEFITPGSVVEAIVEGKGAAEVERGFGMMLFFAFLGGLVLNIFPCVLPVLALKLYSLVEQRDASQSHRQGAGLAYTAGIVLSFMGLAVAVIAMKKIAGVDVAWGFMFQEPAYVIGLAALVFIFGLSLVGVFDVPALGANQAAQAGNKEGLQGHFLTGVFATLIATPCSAPFLGPAMGFALTLDQGGVMLFFAVAGLGLALPFLLVAFVPALIKFLPKPGAWMETFKKVVGWSMVAVVMWLVLWVYGSMSTYKNVMAVAGFLGFLAIACGVFGKYGSIIESGKRQLTMLGVAALIGLFGGWLTMSYSGWMEPAPLAEIDSATVESNAQPLVCAIN